MVSTGSRFGLCLDRLGLRLKVKSLRVEGLFLPDIGLENLDPRLEIIPPIVQKYHNFGLDLHDSTKECHNLADLLGMQVDESRELTKGQDRIS